MSEIDLSKYKPIPGYSRYMVSESGEVWDTKNCTHVAQMNNNGYMSVNIDYGDKKSLEKVHRLVYKAHIGELGHRVVLVHKDGDRSNNHFTNIEIRGKNPKSRTSQQKYLELALSPTNAFKSPYETARAVWYGMMGRCYDVNHKNYHQYGGRGVCVCEEWKDKETFIQWYLDNSITGWAVDKDLLYEDNLVYSPTTCVFIPRGLNSLIAKVDSPKIIKNSRGYSLATYIVCGHKIFYGDSEEDCLEQLSLVRKLQLDKMLWLMEDYVSKIPNSPQIDPRVIQKIREMID